MDNVAKPAIVWGGVTIAVKSSDGVRSIPLGNADMDADPLLGPS
jgi:hypothetical protein